MSGTPKDVARHLKERWSVEKWIGAAALGIFGLMWMELGAGLVGPVGALAGTAAIMTALGCFLGMEPGRREEDIRG